MLKPLALTDAQMNAVYTACQPLLPPDRSAFLTALANVLRHERELGDGVVGRAIKSLQREFFRPPKSTVEPHNSTRRNVGEAIE